MGKKILTDKKRFEIALSALKGEEISSMCSSFEISQAAVYKIRDKAEFILKEGMRRGRRNNTPLRKLEKENKNLKELVADYAVAVEVLKKRRNLN